LPQGLSRGEALEIAGLAQRVGPFGLQLMGMLSEYSSDLGDGAEDIVVRGLDVIDNLGPTANLLLPLIKFLRRPSPKVRSKAAKILGKLTSNEFWIGRHTAEFEDARVRSNLLEAVAQNREYDQGQLRKLLEHAARDSHRRVSTTALHCLARMGDLPSLAQLNLRRKDPDPATRKSADWAVAELEKLKGAGP